MKTYTVKFIGGPADGREETFDDMPTEQSSRIVLEINKPGADWSRIGPPESLIPEIPFTEHVYEFRNGAFHAV